MPWLCGTPFLTIGHERYGLPARAAPIAGRAGIATMLAAMHLARALGAMPAARARRMLVRA